MKHDLSALKIRLTIPELWLRLGLPGAPARTCRSPFRADRTPSFSIHDEGRRWKDFGTGEGGDAIDFLALACAVDLEEATRRFLAMAGAAPSPEVIQRPKVSQSSGGLCSLPPLHRGNLEEIAAAASSRGLAPAAVALARDLGTLGFGTVCGHACWVLLDPFRRIAEARRIDRQPFPALGGLGGRKAHTLRGSAKSWPLGVGVLERLPHFRAVMLVEGGPDYLAALHFCLEQEVYDVLPIALLGRGTGSRIDPAALALLAGRRVRLYPHHDADGGGGESAEKWALQLHDHGCALDFYEFTGLRQKDGQPVNDLNDCAQIAATHHPRLADLLP